MYTNQFVPSNPWRFHSWANLDV